MILVKETEETLLTVTDNLRDLETNFPKIGNCTNSEQFLNESEAINDLANNMPTTITTEESFKRLVTFVTLQESDDEEYSDSDLDDGDEILVIGESGRTKIVKSAFDLIKDKHYSVMSRYLLKYIHTRERYGIKISGKFDPDQIKDENRPPRRYVKFVLFLFCLELMIYHIFLQIGANTHTRYNTTRIAILQGSFR